MAPLVADPVDYPNPHHITGHCPRQASPKISERSKSVAGRELRRGH